MKRESSYLRGLVAAAALVGPAWLGSTGQPVEIEGSPYGVTEILENCRHPTGMKWSRIIMVRAFRVLAHGGGESR